MLVQQGYIIFRADIQFTDAKKIRNIYQKIKSAFPKIPALNFF